MTLVAVGLENRAPALRTRRRVPARSGLLPLGELFLHDHLLAFGSRPLLVAAIVFFFFGMRESEMDGRLKPGTHADLTHEADRPEASH